MYNKFFIALSCFFILLINCVHAETLNNAIVISKYSLNPNRVVHEGDDLSLTLFIDNKSNKKLKDIFLSYEVQNDSLDKIENKVFSEIDKDINFIDSIEPNGRHIKIFNFKIVEHSPPGKYKLNFIFNYYDESQQAFKSESSIEIFIQQYPEIDIFDIKPEKDIVKIGEKYKLEFTIKNLTNDPMEDVNVKLEPTFAVDSTNFTIDELKANNEFTKKTFFYVLDSTSQKKINFIIEYKNIYGDTIVYENSKAVDIHLDLMDQYTKFVPFIVLFFVFSLIFILIYKSVPKSRKHINKVQIMKRF